MANIFVNILVKPEYVGIARQLAARMSSAGEGMFETPLYDTAGNISYYVSTGIIGSEFVVYLQDSSALFSASGGFVPQVLCDSIIASSIVDFGSIEVLLSNHGLSVANPRDIMV